MPARLKYGGKNEVKLILTPRSLLSLFYTTWRMHLGMSLSYIMHLVLFNLKIKVP